MHTRLTVEAQIRIQKGEQVETTAHEAVTDRHYHVAAVEPDGTALLDLFIDNARLTLSRNGMPPVTYDTKFNLVAPKGFEAVEASIGKRLAQMKVTRAGKLVSLLNSQIRATDDPSQSFLDVLPEKPVHVGDEWLDDVSVKVMLSKYLSQKIVLRRKYRLEAVDGNVAKIRLMTAELTPIEDPQVRAQLLKLTPEGTILFDMDRGLVKTRELRCSRVETGVMGQGSVIAATTNLKGSLR